MKRPAASGGRCSRPLQSAHRGLKARWPRFASPSGIQASSRRARGQWAVRPIFSSRETHRPGPKPEKRFLIIPVDGPVTTEQQAIYLNAIPLLALGTIYLVAAVTLVP